MITPRKKYAPGSNWLYLKIYGGPQILEDFLIGELSDLIKEWKQEGRIRLFFFLHYLDPDYHLRLRMELSDPKEAGFILFDIHQTTQRMLEDELLWKIELGTYEPEYERFGGDRIQWLEKWSEVDSAFWLEIKKRLKEETAVELWETVMCSVDGLFDSFHVTLQDKVYLIQKLRDSTLSLGDFPKSIKRQLDAKYRRMSPEIDHLMNNSWRNPNGYFISFQNSFSMLAEEILNTIDSHDSLIQMNLLPDLVHLRLNRAFRTRHRIQELTIYDFLLRFYQSALARC